VPNLYLFGRQSTPPPAWLCPTPTWTDVEREIKATFDQPSAGSLGASAAATRA
jgi:hypothetical protein